MSIIHDHGCRDSEETLELHPDLGSFLIQRGTNNQEHIINKSFNHHFVLLIEY